jgi:hypothetical protein
MRLQQEANMADKPILPNAEPPPIATDGLKAKPAVPLQFGPSASAPGSRLKKR